MEKFALEVKDLIVDYGEVRAVDRVSFSVLEAEQLTLLGPSGSGKTSILRGVAGLEPPEAGEIRLFGREVFNKARKINVPTDKRGIGMVFQSYAIWPHLTVFENVAYPLRIKKWSKSDIDKKVKSVLTLTGMAGFEDRPASNLSGGQQQRVAFARAIVADPRMILLDEPLSNLDAKLRARMRFELKELQKSINITSMYVTHDQEEAFVLSDRIIVLKDGKIEQVGAPEDIYRRPQTKFVAEFIPTANLFTGSISEAKGDGYFIFKVEDRGSIFCRGGIQSGGRRYLVYANASFFTILNTPSKDKVNIWNATVKKSFFVGDFVEYSLESEIGTILIRSLPTHIYKVGDQVSVHVAPENCHLIPE